ncbi:TPA: restriction endonuclease subunit S [Providencia stuartii]|uniref:restriction endonuclease subunit S n=1 Tax=Gammaproteobacteria TaxID=1236 RepID=UPI0005381417|nr:MULTISPECIES: restriction endonuclease subunit S [Gammaproteobacteria]AXO17989.1 restriction endonuclease subunit S [Providencia stuartii]MBN5593573.1 restriction endonuclease subunit S [Providencia stuartii]HEM6907950.1 restriction endonuclease subunit S [Providencia stuartii]HEM7155001.1 restriction endonuclease subunit S [Providencia stuartii]HEM7523337.1 restriction endonuclease subunit S [Providencia stuartii]
MVPNGWNRIALEKIAEVRSGVAKGKKGLKAPIEVPYLRVANVQDGHVDLTEVKTIEIEQDKLERYSLKYGDVLMNEGGDYDKLGRGDVWLGQIEPCLHQNHVFAVRPNQDIVDSFFLAALAASNYGKTYFLSCAKRSTNLASINSTQIKEFPVLVPPLPEQKKIAQILSTWDKAITTTEQLLANSQQQKKALMQQLLTGKKRLLDKNGVRFGGEWKHQRLASLCTIKTGKKDVNEGNPEGNYPFFTCASEPTKSDNYSYDCEALLIAGNGMLGKTHYFNGKFEAYQRTYILSEFIGIDVPFLHQYILYWLMRDIDREKQHGAMPYIKLGLLQNFKVLLPSIAEQQKIAAILSCADQEITALQQKLDALKQEKKALMQQLLTGKRRVLVS